MGRPHPGTDRPLHGPLQIFDLGREIERLLGEREWQEGQRNAITLRKGGGMNVVLMVMKGGDRLEEHAAPGPITLSVREGRVRFTTVDAAVEAGPDELIACDPGVSHSVEAITDAICLLHLTGAS
jgi:quercetin dioxygenase-like cupin family protein